MRLIQDLPVIKHLDLNPFDYIEPNIYIYTHDLKDKGRIFPISKSLVKKNWKGMRGPSSCLFLLLWFCLDGILAYFTSMGHYLVPEVSRNGGSGFDISSPDQENLYVRRSLRENVLPELYSFVKSIKNDQEKKHATKTIRMDASQKDRLWYEIQRLIQTYTETAKPRTEDIRNTLPEATCRAKELDKISLVNLNVSDVIRTSYSFSRIYP